MAELASKPGTIGFQIHSVLCWTPSCLNSYVTYLHGASHVVLVVKKKNKNKKQETEQFSSFSMWDFVN